MKRLNAGRLKHTIEIYQRYTSQDAAGQPFDTWVLVLTAKAEVKPLIGREYLAAQQTVSELTHDVTMRYHPVVKANQKIK